MARVRDDAISCDGYGIVADVRGQKEGAQSLIFVQHTHEIEGSFYASLLGPPGADVQLRTDRLRTPAHRQPFDVRIHGYIASSA